MTEQKKIDVAIIGGGPGGYVAGIKAAQQGKQVVIIEKCFLGGTCLNVGCIPTKALLAHAHLLKEVEKASHFGIEIGDVKIDYTKMVERKDLIVKNIRKSLEGLIKTNDITIIHGEAKFLSPTLLSVTGEKELTIQATSIIIATGSLPVDVSTFPCDHRLIRNSTSMLTLKKLPKSLVIVGGGYIGCEFATLYSRLGVKVTIVEAFDSILCNQEKSVRDLLAKSYARRDIDVMTNTQVEKIDCENDHVKVFIKDRQEPLVAEMSLIAVGRKANSGKLDLEKANVKINEKGHIQVNEKMQTNIPNIYAIGDVTGGWMLAHVSSHQGMVAADNICGKQETMTYHAIPAVIYSHPEIASVGLTEEMAKEKNFDVVSGKYPFNALGKSLTTAGTDGFAMIIADKKTEKILGAHLIGDEASTLIGEMTLAIQNGLTLSDVTKTLHAHPSLPEALLEASLVAKETPIHYPPKKR